MRCGLVLVLVGCGRLGFDPSDASTEAPSDGRVGDGVPSTSDAPAGGDAAAMTACTSPDVIPVVVGTRIATTTCATDLLDGCGPANTMERVFSFVPPMSGSYVVRAFDAGTNDVSTSVGVVRAGCTTAMGCAGILGTSYTAGVTVYFAFESSSGGCQSIEVLVD